MVGSVWSRRKRSVMNGCNRSPSAWVATALVSLGPSAPTRMGGAPNGLGPGLNVGCMRVNV